MNFGEKLKTLRKEKGLTQEQLATMTGLSRRTIVNYEQAGRYPQNHGVYAKLAEALGCEENYLKSEESNFITEVASIYGKRGEDQAQQIIEQTAALFAGGDLSEEDKLAFLHEIQTLYFDSKERAKKFTPKKYRNQEKK